MKINGKKTPAISVLIPTKNGEYSLAELLAMLSLQTVEFAEIIIVDSASQDNTVTIARTYGADVLHIDPTTFDHGGTRTALAKKAKGEILVFFTQDAIPKKRNSVELLIEPLLNDDKIATCYGRQLPSFKANYFAINLRHFNYPDKSAVKKLQDKEYLGIKTAFTSNSFACYRKSSLEGIGYFQDGLIFGEDTVAAGHLLMSGQKVAYVAEAQVYHSHNFSLIDEFKRYFDIGVLHQNEKWLLDTFGRAEGHGKQYLRYEMKRLFRKKYFELFPELCSRIFLKFLGYKLGSKYKILPKRVIQCFSSHSSWWDNGKSKNKN